MPQKKNADSLELIRGKTGRIFGRVSNGSARVGKHANPRFVVVVKMMFVSQFLHLRSSAKIFYFLTSSFLCSVQACR